MLSQRVYTVLRLILPKAAKYGLTGFSWSKHDKVLQKLKSHEKNRFLFNFIVFLLYNAFVGLQCIRFMFLKIDYEKLNVSVTYFLALSILLQYWIINLCFIEAVIKVTNLVLTYLRHINRK